MTFCKSSLFAITRLHFCLNQTISGLKSAKARRIKSSSHILSWRVLFSSVRTMGDSSKDEVIEAFACRVNDLKDGEMCEISIGEGKALLVRDEGKYSAIGHKCTHYGAPLVKGVFKNGQVRCPWHGACFDVKTGDIEDFPGLDCVPQHEVHIRNGDKVYIRAAKSALANHKRQKPMVQTQNKDGPHVLIIGGGAAAITCAETLRQMSFNGTVTIATMENHLPYDRPKLSKAMDVSPESIYLRKQEFFDAFNIQILKGKKAKSIDSNQKSVTFEDGGVIKFDKLLISTGGRPRTLPIPGWGLKNVFVLRTPDDANIIATAAKDKNVVVCGASFIGMEVASSLVSKAKSVSVCEYFSVPFERVLGKEVGLYLQRLHESKGVKFFMNASMIELKGNNDEVQQAVLQDGTMLDADLVIAGVGVVPSTDFLAGSNIAMTKQGFVNVDRYLRCVKEGGDGKKVYDNIFAGGDIAMYPQKTRNWQPSNVQHWQMAHKHGRTVGANMVRDENEMQPVSSVPFFWTQQFGKSLRYTGNGMGYDDIVVSGDIAEGKFCAYYTIKDEVVAVATMMSDPVASATAQRMLAGERILKSEIK